GAAGLPGCAARGDGAVPAVRIRTEVVVTANRNLGLPFHVGLAIGLRIGGLAGSRRRAASADVRDAAAGARLPAGASAAVRYGARRAAVVVGGEASAVLAVTSTE